MPSLDTVFAYTVAVLAGLAVIGALAVVIVAEVYAIRRTIERHRRPDAIYVRPSRSDPSTRYWREHSAVTIPEAEHEPVRQATGRVLAGDRLTDIARETRP
jgi:hypothetical protein